MNSFVGTKKKIQLLYLLFFLFAIFPRTEVFSQSNNEDDKFIINGELVGKDTGTVILWYNDKLNNGIADTIQLSNGKFRFSGAVNGFCEALLWTDIQNRSFDDPSVVRFLLEPGTIYISKMNDESNAIIKGSESQAEKEEWDKKKTSLLESKELHWETLYSLNKLSKGTADPALKAQLSELEKKLDSVTARIRERDVDYIRTHPNSYLSGYLLHQHGRRLFQDSVKQYYSSLADYVRRSSVGYDVLKYIYPLTDDQEFRKANPLIDKKFDERLSGIKSVHDFSLKDTSGGIVNFNSFKGKYLVIDFWASWCKPCLENVPAWNKLVKSYDTASIQFISISLDKDVDPWKKSIIRHKHKGIQAIDLNAFSSLIAVYSKVVWVPTYIIADPNGLIIRYDAPQPIDPELKKILDGLIE